MSKFVFDFYVVFFHETFLFITNFTRTMIARIILNDRTRIINVETIVIEYDKRCPRLNSTYLNVFQFVSDEMNTAAGRRPNSRRKIEFAQKKKRTRTRARLCVCVASPAKPKVNRRTRRTRVYLACRVTGADNW